MVETFGCSFNSPQCASREVRICGSHSVTSLSFAVIPERSHASLLRSEVIYRMSFTEGIVYWSILFTEQKYWMNIPLHKYLTGCFFTERNISMKTYHTLWKFCWTKISLNEYNSVQKFYLQLFKHGLLFFIWEIFCGMKDLLKVENNSILSSYFPRFACQSLFKII